MGMFDRVVVSGVPLRCHAGHDITGEHNLEHFQTKDLTNTLGTLYITPDGVASHDSMRLGDPMEGCARPWSLTLEIYRSCPTCGVWCEFDVTIENDKAKSFDLRAP